MSKHDLTKVEALKLIAPIVDGETTTDEYEAFMNFIADNPDVRDKYESMKNTKSLVSSRCPCDEAPDTLQEFARGFCKESTAEKSTADSPASVDTPEVATQSTSGFGFVKIALSAAASVLLILSIWQLFSFLGSSTKQASYNIEEHAYQYFTKHNGNFIKPTINTASLGNAEIKLASDYDMPMTVPSLKNAAFQGVVYNEFVPNFKAPMLEYHLADVDEYIYIFAFKIKRLEAFKKLFRNEEAINSCNGPKDFHIREVEGKHIVSWKWNNVWYAAVSNHHGDTLASLVKPLQYSSNK